MSPSDSISVVLRTTNSEESLKKLLPLLQTKLGDEIIVVDTGSNDGTLSVARQAGARVISDSGEFNYSRALNLGFSAAKNYWVLSLSVHCPPAGSNLLQVYLQAIRQIPDDVGVIYGLQVFSDWQYAKLAKEIIVNEEQSESALDKRRPGGNSNALYRKAIWEKHPFEEYLATAEDYEWCRWALRSGYKFAEAGAAAVYYHNKKDWNYRYKKACTEIWVFHKAKLIPKKSFWACSLSVLSATGHLLLREQLFKPWLGHIAHECGVYHATRHPKEIEGAMKP